MNSYPTVAIWADEPYQRYYISACPSLLLQHIGSRYSPYDPESTTDFTAYMTAPFIYQIQWSLDKIDFYICHKKSTILKKSTKPRPFFLLNKEIHYKKVHYFESNIFEKAVFHKIVATLHYQNNYQFKSFPLIFDLIVKVIVSVYQNLDKVKVLKSTQTD